VPSVIVSKRKLAANRRNAARSTGPNTAKGKACASRNAYKHGLAVSVLNDPVISREVERLARSIVGKRSDAYELAQARIVAEAEFDLLRVRSTSVNIIDATAATNGLNNQALANEGQAQHPLLGALLQLEVVDRYERRAFSRRGRAIRQMYRSRI
jgi:hypothetical protein